jgi:branched-chain amino acid transport system substrate-binding protein
MRVQDWTSRMSVLAVLVATGVLASAAIAARTTHSSSSALPGTVKIGAMLSLSGSNAFASLEALKGMQLAVDQLNKAHYLGKSKIQLVTADDASDPNQGITAMKTLIYQNKVAAVTGGTVSSVVLPALNVPQDAQVPYVISNTFTPGITYKKQFIFQLSQPTQPYQLQLVREAVPALGIKTAAIFYATDVPTDLAIRHDFEIGLKKAGVKIVADEGAPLATTDHSAFIQKARTANADLLVTSLTGTTDAALVVEAARNGYRPKAIFGHIGDITPSYYQIGGSAVVGAFHTTAFASQTSIPAGKAFVKEYEARFNATPGINGAEGYASIKYLAQGIKAANSTNHVAIQKAMARIKKLSTILGTTGSATVDRGRIMHYQGFIVRTGSDGSFVPWKP